MLSWAKMLGRGLYEVSSVKADRAGPGGVGAEGIRYEVPGAGTKGEGNDCRLASEALPGDSSGDINDGVDGKS